MRRRHLMLFCLQLAFAALLVSALLGRSSWHELSRLWSMAHTWLWGVVIALLIVYFLLGCMSLLVLLDTAGRRFASARFLVDYGFIQAAAVFTPARGAEGALAFVKSRGDVPAGEIAPALLIQRIAQVLLMAAMAVVGMIACRLVGLVGAFVVIAALICIFAVTAVNSQRLRGLIGGLLTRLVGQAMTGFYARWRTLLQERKGTLATHALLMGIRLMAAIWANYLIVLSFGYSVPFAAWIGIFSAAGLTTLVPVTIWGIGTVEGVMVFGLAQFGVDVDGALSVCLVWRGLYLLTLFGWVAIYMGVRLLDVYGFFKGNTT